MNDVALFTPITINGLAITHRAWVAPMCQYSVDARDGMPTDWHLVHYGAFAQGGFALILTEATAVDPVGRITPHDVGLWNDVQATSWQRITDFVHAQEMKIAGESIPVRIGVQLAHAGRKASVHRPFDPESGSLAEGRGGWTTLAPSPLAFEGYGTPYALPEELDEAGIRRIIDSFQTAAQRAKQAGFDVVEIHAAHGYLLHEFFSPLSNHRNDQWGGDFTGRTRLVVEVVDAVREVWDGPLFVRISATDWVEGGWDIDQSIQLAGILDDHGVDVVDVSSGGNVIAEMPLGPGYQTPLSRQIRAEAGVATAIAGLIDDPVLANKLVAEGDADAIMLARGALREPHWSQRAAYELGWAGAKGLYRPQHVQGIWGERDQFSSARKS